LKKAEILTRSIDEVLSGKSTIEDCVARYPKFAKELRSLVQIAANLRPDEVAPTSEFRERAKRRLLEEMSPSQVKASSGFRAWLRPVPARIIASVSIGVVVVVAGASTVYAAQRSLPGDALYPVKTGVENIQLAATSDTTAKATLDLKLAQTRFQEMTQEARSGRKISATGLATAQQQLDEAIKEMSGSRSATATGNVLSRMSKETLAEQLELEQALASAPEARQPVLEQALAMARRGSLIARVAYSNREFLRGQPSVSDDKLEAGEFDISGTLQSIQGQTWDVGGVILPNVVFSGTVPAVGSAVTLEGLVKGNEVFISAMQVSESSGGPTRLEGQFGGTDRSGISKVGGISVKISGNNGAQLEPGDNIQVQGGAENGKFDVTGNESQQPGATSGTILNGALTAVDAGSFTITVETAGSQVTVNVSEARIDDGNGRTIRLSGLNYLVGREVRLSGLYKRGDILYCRQVRVRGQ